MLVSTMPRTRRKTWRQVCSLPRNAGTSLAKGVAHSLQNFAPSRLSAPHFVQRVFPTVAI